MSHTRRLSGGAAKCHNSDGHCDDCDSAAKHGSDSKLSQGKYKSDVVSDSVSKRNDDKENFSDDRKVLLSITVELEDGCVDHIQLKDGDSAEAVATKFCQEHSLPEQFVAPLTEHIVNSIISLSEEPDSDIVFHSQEEVMSNDENSTLRGGAPYSAPTVNGCGDSVTKSRVYGGRPASAEPNAVLARREPRKMDVPTKTLAQASQRVSRPPPACSCASPSGSRPRKKTSRHRKRGRKNFSDRLVAPTITSLAKRGALDHMKKSKARVRPLSEQAKALCMRLHTEYLKQEHRCRDEVKRSNALYQENVLRRQFLSKVAKQYKNYGELLYAEGLTRRQNQIKAVQERAEQVESIELAEVTLRPKISKRSRDMRRNQEQVWSRLQCNDRPKQDQLQELRREVCEAKLLECTFRPQINYQRRNGCQDQYGDYYCNRFEQLFLDAESRRRRRAECMQWQPEGVTFQPSINRGIPYGTSLMDEDCLQERSVFRRLLDNAARVMEKKQMQELLSHRPFDPRTGRELFKPHIGRKPFNRNPVHLPIGDYLHRMNCAFNSKIRSLAARENRIKKEQARARYVGPYSQRLLQRLKNRGIKQVFDTLDTDKDGYVDLTTANFDRLNVDVIEDLNRLMKMPGGKEKIDYDKFADLMQKTEKEYHLGQQLHFGLKHRKHNDSGDNCTFQFRMDQLSRRLAKERRKFSTHEQWWQIIIAEYLANLQKIEKWRKQRLQQEMAECTFKPYLTRVSSGRIEKSSGGELATCGAEGGFVQTISDLYEKLRQEVQGFYFQNERGGPELLGMARPSTPDSARSGNSGRRILVPRPDRISELDDLPKTKTGLFFGLMGA